MKKVPYVHQLNATECGVCVLTMMLRYFGAYHSLQEVRNQLPVGRDGVTIRRLINAFHFYGIEASVYRGNIDSISEIMLPAIINWEDEHFVVLERISHNYIFIVDSKHGRTRMTYEEFSKSYSGIVILLSKTAQFKKKRRHLKFANSFSDIMAYYRKNIVFFIVLSLLTQIIALSIPITIQHLIDGLFSMSVKPSQLSFFVIAILLNAIFMYAKKRHMTNLGVNIDRDVNKKIISKLLKLNFRT